MSQDPRDPNLPPTAQPQPSPAQPGAQPPYGYPGQAAQPPYGYPASPQGQAYGQPYQQPQPYPGYQAGYAGYAGYPASTYGTAAAKPKPKSPMLGILGFGIVVVTGIIAILIGLMMAEPMAAIVALAPPGSTQIDVEDIPPALLERLTAPMTWLGMASLVGLGGWIVSIVAAVSNRGRGWGVAGIILGVIAPIAALIAMSVAAVAAVS